MRWVLAGMAAAAFGVAGCDDVSFDDTSDFEDLSTANAAMSSRVAALPIASTAEMPTLGSATFSGYTSIALGTDIASTLVGTTEMTADFGNATLTGLVDNVEGTVDGGFAQPYDGTLVIDDGTIGGSTASGFDASIGGILTSATDVVGVDGAVAGHFRSGDRDASALTGISGGDTVFTVDGQVVPGLLAVVAER